MILNTEMRKTMAARIKEYHGKYLQNIVVIYRLIEKKTKNF